jgi:hypothetical protein
MLLACRRSLWSRNDSMASSTLTLGLTLAALLDAAALYMRLIWRRAARGRAVREHEDAALRSLVRVLLVDEDSNASRSR